MKLSRTSSHIRTRRRATAINRPPGRTLPRWCMPERGRRAAYREKYGRAGVRHRPKWGCTIEPSRTGTSLHSDSREPPRVAEEIGSTCPRPSIVTVKFCGELPGPVMTPVRVSSGRDPRTRLLSFQDRHRFGGQPDTGGRRAGRGGPGDYLRRARSVAPRPQRPRQGAGRLEDHRPRRLGVYVDERLGVLAVRQRRLERQHVGRVRGGQHSERRVRLEVKKP